MTENQLWKAMKIHVVHLCLKATPKQLKKYFHKGSIKWTCFFPMKSRANENEQGLWLGSWSTSLGLVCAILSVVLFIFLGTITNWNFFLLWRLQALAGRTHLRLVTKTSVFIPGLNLVLVVADCAGRRADSTFWPFWNVHWYVYTHPCTLLWYLTSKLNRRWWVTWQKKLGSLCGRTPARMKNQMDKCAHLLQKLGLSLIII